MSVGSFARQTAAAGLFLLAGGAAAQDSCPGADVILGLAQTILDARPALNPLEQGRIGPEALYLAMHYGGQTPERLVMLAAMAAEPRNQEAADLAAALVGINGLAMIDQDPVVAISRAGLSLQRAVILADRGETYARLMSAALGNLQLFAQADAVFQKGRYLPYLLADQDDQMRLDVASAAEAHGLPEMAALLLADRADPAPYFDLLARYPDHQSLHEIAGPAALATAGATLRLGQMIVDPALAADDADALYRRDNHALLRVSWLAAPANFLTTVVNQTGRDAELAQVAQATWDAVAAGRVDPVADPDALWLFEYRALAEQFGIPGAHQALNGFDFPSQRIRHFAGLAVDTLDTILARETLGPYLRGAEAALPDRPALLSAGFVWEDWQRLAPQVRAGASASVTLMGDADFPIIAEMLAEQGQWLLAATAAAPSDSAMPRLILTRDMLQRADRLCDAALAHPGQGMTGAGAFLWKF